MQSAVFAVGGLSNEFAKDVVSMASSKDLRYVKTERQIEDTYIALKKKSRSPVQASELCQAALINKTTFYTHYEMMDALHEHIFEKQVEAIIEACRHVNEAFSDTSTFIHSMIQAIRNSSKITFALFGKETTKQINVFEACLLKCHLHGDESDEKRMTIIFVIGCAAHLLITDQSDDRIEMTIRLIGRLLPERKEKIQMLQFNQFRFADKKINIICQSS